MSRALIAVLAAALAAGPICGCSAAGRAEHAITPVTLSSGAAHPGQHSPAPASAASVSPAAPGQAAGTPGNHDPATVRALLRIAQAFNNDYDRGDFGAVYDRWDARSQALISRGDYIRRHILCAPATGSAARVESATKAAGGAWQVHYEISGEQLADTWFYVHHRWVFDIVASNPAAARQYRLPFAQYAAAAGCSTR